MRPALLLLALALPSAAFSVKVRKGTAVALVDRPAWTAREAGAETALLREGPGPGEGQELWRVKPGWSWAPEPRGQDVVIVVVSGRLKARAGTLAKTLGAGEAAVFPAGTPFELAAAGWLRRTVFLLSANPPAPR